CSITVWNPVALVKELPTAQTLPDDTARTARNWLNVPAGLGLGTADHCEPFQCRARVCCPALSAKLPTAQASLAETARTSSSTLPSAPGLGLGTTVQDEPSQCSVRVWSPPLAASKPAAQTSHGEISVTPVKVLSTVLAATGDAPVRLTHVAA